MKMSILITLLFLFVVFPIEAYGKGDTRILFVIQSDREEETLRQDAQLIADTVRKAGHGDRVEGMMFDGRQIFELSIRERNPLKARKQENAALNRLREFCLGVLKSEEKSGEADVASALKRGIERFNAEIDYRRYLTVLFSSGLQNTKSINLRNGRYPSDTWLSHPHSPFAAIPANQTGKNVEVIFVPQAGDFASTFHAQRIERFYSLLLDGKKVQLVGFSDDHKTASEIILRGARTAKPVPQIEHIDEGKLIIYRIGDAQTGCIEESSDSGESSMKPAQAAPSTGNAIAASPHVATKPSPVAPVKSRPVPTIVSGSVLNIQVRQGMVKMWVSLRDPHGNPLSGVKAGDIRLRENRNGQMSDVPGEDVKISSLLKQPVASILVRDISGSLDENALKECDRAIRRFIDSMRTDDAAGIIYFHSSIHTVASFSTDRDHLKSRLVKPVASGGTALYDALVEAVNTAKSWRSAYLKAVVAFTDGVDNDSRNTAEGAVEAARRASIPIFLVGAGNADEGRLRVIAAITGGVYYAVSDPAALQKIYHMIANVINDSYLISYPTSADAGDMIEVSATLEFKQNGRFYQGWVSSGFAEAFQSSRKGKERRNER